MHKPKMLRSFVAFLLMMSASLVMVTDASAKPEFLAPAAAAGINTSSGCATCHTSAAGTAANIKPNYKAAYRLDTAGYTRLKNLIKGCTTFGQTLSKVNFLCQLPITKAGTVGLAGSGLLKTDIYTVTCAAGTTSLFAAVKDLAPIKLPLVSIQVKKTTFASAFGTDAKDGDAVYSPLISLAKAAGVYTVNVKKSAYTGTLATHKGPETYSALFSCRNAVGTQLGTTAVIKQNQ